MISRLIIVWQFLKQLESDILSRYSGLISNFHQESLLCLKEQLLDSIILKNNWLTAELSKEGGSGAIDVEEFYGNKFHEIINNIIGYIKNEYEQLLWLSDYEKMELDNWLDGFRKYINDINGEINYLKNPGIAVDFSLCNKLNNQMDLIERIHSDIVHFSDFFDNLKRKKQSLVIKKFNYVSYEHGVNSDVIIDKDVLEKESLKFNNKADKTTDKLPLKHLPKNETAAEQHYHYQKYHHETDIITPKTKYRARYENFAFKIIKKIREMYDVWMNSLN